MRIFFNFKIILYLIVFLGCPNKINAGKNSSNALTEVLIDSHTITGVVQLGRVRNATVKVFKCLINGSFVQVAETTTNANGEYSVSGKFEAGIPLLVQASDGNYTNEADNREMKNGVLSAFIPDVSNKTEIAITPLSHIVAQRLSNNLGTPDENSRLYKKAVAHVALVLNITTDTVTAIPTSPDDTVDGSTVGGKAAVAIASLSQYIQDLKEAGALDAGFANSVFYDALAADFSDGRLDGKSGQKFLGNIPLTLAANFKNGIIAAQNNLATNPNTKNNFAAAIAAAPVSIAPVPIAPVPIHGPPTFPLPITPACGFYGGFGCSINCSGITNPAEITCSAFSDLVGCMKGNCAANCAGTCVTLTTPMRVSCDGGSGSFPFGAVICMPTPPPPPPVCPNPACPVMPPMCPNPANPACPVMPPPPPPNPCSSGQSCENTFSCSGTLHCGLLHMCVPSSCP